MSIIKPLASATTDWIYGGSGSSQGAASSAASTTPVATTGVTKSVALPQGQFTSGKLQSLPNSGTVVNVINNSQGTEVRTEKSRTSTGGEQIDVIVVQSVAKAIGEGRLDKTFKETYGINRTGR